MRYPWVIAALVSALLFVCMEGFMIWYLLHVQKSHARLTRCIEYSFVGFFFSGITPSATGGQPMQLYYMQKDKIGLAESSAVLMTVAVLYKFILVVMGVGIGVLLRGKLGEYLGKYFYLYWFGMLLNIVVVAVLVFIMISPAVFRRIILSVERALVRIHILKVKEEREKKLEKMVLDFSETIRFFKEHKIHIVFVTCVTFVQRVLLFLPTYFVYRGMGYKGQPFFLILVLQATVYIAVDMLPLPGAQGITEVMYKRVFSAIFFGGYLTASTIVSRGINFYFLLVISGIIALIAKFTSRRIKTWVNPQSET